MVVTLSCLLAQCYTVRYVTITYPTNRVGATLLGLGAPSVKNGLLHLQGPLFHGLLGNALTLVARRVVLITSLFARKQGKRLIGDGINKTHLNRALADSSVLPGNRLLAILQEDANRYD